jgi:hypothetical protein
VNSSFSNPKSWKENEQSGKNLMSLYFNFLFLQHVDIAHWAGLGGVRFIPQDFILAGEKGEKGERGELVELGEEENRLVNQRNMELVATLRNTDSAFSLGEGPPPESHMCVR